MKAVLRILLNLVLVQSVAQASNSLPPRQERASPLLPDFKPFQHPAQKLSRGDLSEPHNAKLYSVGSPLSQIYWLDFVPVFGRIYTLPQGGSSGHSLPILGCLTGLTVLAAVWYTKAGNGNVKKEKCDSRYPEEIKRECHEQTITLEPFQPVYQEDVKETVSAKNPPKEIKEIREEVAEPVFVEQEKIEKVATSKGIQYCQQQLVDEPNFSRKIKTFKLVKEPKSCKCEEIYHGLISEVLSILEVMQFQRTQTLKSMTRSVIADVDIEGANISRLRITDVRSKDKEVLVAKTMTVKEYMTLEANKKIEEAMELVKQNCSVQNIMFLADTIKKYRPDNAQSTQSV